ncbi:MAG: hypothetical protein IKC89_03585, partial [Lentisphaeria bacterium]|nr:hypothetical protein [Lentisphaeria bacterium]
MTTFIAFDKKTFVTCFVNTAKKKALLQAADAVCGKVVFCKREARGVYDCTRPERRATQGAKKARNAPPQGDFLEYYRRMQCEARSCFASEKRGECTTVLDPSGERRKARDCP